MAGDTTHKAPQGLHLVGSTPFKSVREHFVTIGNDLGSHIQSITDGESEPPLRTGWVGCLMQAFIQLPWILSTNLEALVEKDRQASGLETISEANSGVYLENLRLEYDSWAIASYTLLKELKAQGLVPEHLKFQVGVPTVSSICLYLIRPQYRAKVEPFCQAALTRALRNIQNQIVHDELVIQVEAGAETFFLEGGWKRENMYGLDSTAAPWFGESDELVRNGVSERLEGMINDCGIDDDVDLGLHFCYGDHYHKHFVEPSSTNHIATIAEHSVRTSKHNIKYIHFPVPKDREDESYLQPMKELWPNLHKRGIYLYVGLVHGNDEEGTQRRIDAARKAFGSEGWGIANECGLSRTPAAEFQSSLAISTAIANSWS